MKPKIVAFVPLKKISRRLTGKNLKLLDGKPLYVHILETLAKIRRLDKIYVYASDPIFSKNLPKKVEFLRRPKALDHSNLRGPVLYQSFAETIPADFYLLAHATAPFLKAKSIDRSLHAVLSGRYDSAFSGRKLQSYLWWRGKALNHKPDYLVGIPQLEPGYMESVGFYIYSRALILQQGRRIGFKPYLCEVDTVEGLDIDYPLDFKIAQLLLPIAGKS